MSLSRHSINFNLFPLMSLRLLTAKLLERRAAEAKKCSRKDTAEWCENGDGKGRLSSWERNRIESKDTRVHWLKLETWDAYTQLSTAHNFLFSRECCLPNKKREDFLHIFSFYSHSAFIPFRWMSTENRNTLRFIFDAVLSRECLPHFLRLRLCRLRACLVTIFCRLWVTISYSRAVSASFLPHTFTILQMWYFFLFL